MHNNVMKLHYNLFHFYRFCRLCRSYYRSLLFMSFILSFFVVFLSFILSFVAVFYRFLILCLSFFLSFFNSRSLYLQ